MTRSRRTAAPRRAGTGNWPPRWTDELRRAARPRYAVLALLLLTYIWRFHDLTPVVSALRIAAVATVGSWLFLLVAPNLRQLGRAVRLPYVVCFLLFSAWAGLIVPSAMEPRIAWNMWWEGHFKNVTMFLFVVSCLPALRYVRFAVAVQAIGGGVLALFYVKSGFSQAYTPVPSYDRNDFALALNVALPLTLYLALAAQSRPERLMLWGSAGVITVCVMFSQSRGGFLTLGCIMLFAIVRVRGIKLWQRLLPPAVMIGSLLLAPPEVKDRLATLLEPTEDYNYDSEIGRIAIWKRGLGYMTVDDHMILGLGMGNFPVAEARLSGLARNRGRELGAVTHNSFLEVLTETGVPGFLLYMGMVGGALVSLFLVRRRMDRFRRDSQAHDLVLAADFTMLSITAFCVGGMFLSLGYSPLIFAQIALAAGVQISARAVEKRIRAGPVRSSRRRRDDRAGAAPTGSSV